MVLLRQPGQHQFGFDAAPGPCKSLDETEGSGVRRPPLKPQRQLEYALRRNDASQSVDRLRPLPGRADPGS
jgi:hypothetical protein